MLHFYIHFSSHNRCMDRRDERGLGNCILHKFLRFMVMFSRRTSYKDVLALIWWSLFLFNSWNQPLLLLLRRNWSLLFHAIPCRSIVIGFLIFIQRFQIPVNFEFGSNLSIRLHEPHFVLSVIVLFHVYGCLRSCLPCLVCPLLLLPLVCPFGLGV